MQCAKKEVRDRFINSAIVEFQTKGFERASLRNVVESAGSSLGNLYRYFENKESLYNAIVEPLIDECIESTKTIDIEACSAKTIASQVVNFYEKNITIFDILQKGTYKAYSVFLNKFSLATQNIIEKYLNSILDKSKKADKDICIIITNSFIGGLRVIMETYKTKDSALKQIEELINIIFKDVDKRLF